MSDDVATDPNLTILDLQTAMPTLRLERRIDISQLTTVMEAQSVDGAPILSGAPAASGQVVTATDGTAWFVPVAVLPKMSSSSPTPHVFIDDTPDGWALQVAIDLVRPEGVAPEAQPLPVDGITIALNSSTSVAFTDLADMPPPDETVVRRILASSLVDRDAIVAALDSVSTATFTVLATVHYRTPGVLVEETPGPFIDTTAEVISATRVQFDPSIFAVAQPLVSRSALRDLTKRAAVAEVATESPQRRLRRRFSGFDIAAIVPTATAPSNPASLQLALTANGVPISAFFPNDIPAFRRIYARALTGVSGNADAVWVSESNGLWREAVVPNEFYLLPDEYRIAVDAETGMPAMSVLLVTTNAPDGSTSYKVRASVRVAPWVDPTKSAALRTTVAQREGLVHPRMVVGGAESATFVSRGGLSQLGGALLAPGGVGDPSLTVAVNQAGFTLDFDCTLEFYTLLCQHLSGATGQPLGNVQLKLRTGEAPENVTEASITANLRLDRLAEPLLAVSMGQPPAGDATSLTVTISNLAAYPVTVSSIVATLLTTTGEPPAPLDAAPGVCNPTALSLAPRGDGAAVTTVVLTPDADLDLASVDAVELAFTSATVTVKPAEVLERVHQVAATGSITSEVTLRSYLMQHPDQLPPGLTDVFGLEVQIERGSGTPVSLFITRDEPEKTVDIAFGFTDLVAGMSPNSPELKVRRRNLIPTGHSGWGAWESSVGRELFVTPVLPGDEAPT